MGNLEVGDVVKLGGDANAKSMVIVKMEVKKNTAWCREVRNSMGVINGRPRTYPLTNLTKAEEILGTTEYAMAQRRGR